MVELGTGHAHVLNGYSAAGEGRDECGTFFVQQAPFETIFAALGTALSPIGSAGGNGRPCCLFVCDVVAR